MGRKAKKSDGFIKWHNPSGNKFLERLNNSEEARRTIAAFLKMKDGVGSWRGYVATPAGSPLDTILRAFEKETDIPLELPFFSFLFYLSGFLVEKGIKFDFAGRERTPEFWSIVLAPSGAGKTFSSGIIGKAAPVAAEFPECASGAKFLEALSEMEREQKPMLWLQDEFAQKLRQIETPGGPLSDAKEYLLRAYDGNPIERNTKSGGKLRVEKPLMSILGLNTDEGFYKVISPESLIDGFAQRFAFVVADRDPNRPFIEYPLYEEKPLREAAKKAFDAIEATPLHSKYFIGEAGRTAFEEAFRLLFDSDIPQSFYRRILFLGTKYALFYHIILGKTGEEIDAQDMAWASRLCEMHMNDIKRMLASTVSDLARMLGKAQELKDRYEREGKELTARDIAQRVHGVNTAAEAKGLIAMLANGEK